MTRTQGILLGIAATLLVIVAFVAGRGCTPGPIVDPLPIGIDAGPGEDEINARLDGAIQGERARFEAIEQKFEEDVAAFDAQQREEYERVSRADLDEAARMLSQWNQERRRRRADGGF